MTDEPSVTFTLDATSPRPTSILDVLPRLIVRCREKELDLYIATGSVLESDNSDQTPVRIRWGAEPPEEADWGRSTDYTAAFAPYPRHFLTRLMATPDLRVEVHPYDATPVVITFNARGLDRHMDKLNAACPMENDGQASTVDSPQADLGAVNDDQVFMESVVEERPEVLSGPALNYPDLLRQAGVQGRVLVQAIIDTSGRAEPPSVKVIQSPNPGFDQPAKNYVLRALFRPARVHGRAVRVLVNLPIDFKVKGKSKRP